MKLRLSLQKASTHPDIPTKRQFQQWVDLTLGVKNLNRDTVELCIRIVDLPESAHLNQTYRHKEGPTNILSFPQDLEESQGHLGDIALCAPLVSMQAQEEGIESLAHWAHLTVHGTLHLLGYDHHTDGQAQAMIQEEISILKQLGYENPYV